MEDIDLKNLAEELKKPSGKSGVQVAEKMNKDNFLINQNTIEHLDLENNNKILEIGMGNGFFVKDIFKINSSVNYIGCDFSETMVNEAINLNESFVKNGQADFVLSNAEYLPFPNLTFDKVFSVHTIYFWNKPSIIFSEIHRVLKTNGELIIAIRPKSIMEQYPYTQFGFSLYDRYSLASLLSDNNFEVIKIVEKEEYKKEVKGVNISVETLLITGAKK